MNVINFGYRIPFDTLSTPIILKNNMSSGDSFVGTGPRKISLMVTVKTYFDGLAATGFTVKSRSVEQDG
jgi:hypothetical protein